MSEVDKLLSGAGMMTASELQRRVRILSNQTFCRHWLHMYSLSDGVYVMGLQCRDHNGTPVEILSHAKDGFVESEDKMYLIRRANEDGSPFTGSSK